MISVKASALLALRNALVAGDVEAAYCELCMMADPDGCVGDEWAEWEAAAQKEAEA